MPTECIADLFGSAPVEGRRIEASFDGGSITSDAGGLLLGATDRAIGLVDRFARCFTDHRDPELIEHEVRTLVGQRVYGLAMGYEDLNDHDQLRHDPLLAVLLGKLAAKRADCAPVAGNLPKLAAQAAASQARRAAPMGEARKLYDRLEKVVGSFCPGLAKAPLHIHRFGASHHHPHTH